MSAITDLPEDETGAEREDSVDNTRDERLLEAVINGHLDEIKVLVLAGAKIDFANSEGRTPLHFAAEKNDLEMAKFLVLNGHPWNVVDNKGISAGELAYKRGYTELYKWLVDEGVRTELLLRALIIRDEEDESEKPVNSKYLTQRLRYVDNKLLDENNDAVMMGWELPIMIEHAKIMCPNEGLTVLNVGFGLGLIDEELQKYHPQTHYIIEAHPDVYDEMLKRGWDKKTGVKILFGRWQKIVPTLDIIFDAIFFDTYGEFYDDLKEFHENAVNLLKSDGIYTWFNGLGATSQFFHDVYCQVSEVDLREMGMSTEYVDIPFKTANEEDVWEGVRQRYYVLDVYKLPICKFLV